MVDVAPDRFQLGMVVSRQSLVALLFQFLDLHLHFLLVDALDLVMGVHFDPESLTQGGQQVLLVHLTMALHGFVLDARGDLTQLCDGLPFQFLKRMCHVFATFLPRLHPTDYKTIRLDTTAPCDLWHKSSGPC